MDALRADTDPAALHPPPVSADISPMDFSYFDTILTHIRILPVVWAAISIALGFVLWSAGLRAAKLFSTMIMGMVLGVFCTALFTPLGIPSLTAAVGVAGLVVGAMAGSMAFTLVQGSLLGFVLAIVVCISYGRWQSETLASLSGPHGTAYEQHTTNTQSSIVSVAKITDAKAAKTPSAAAQSKDLPSPFSVPGQASLLNGSLPSPRELAAQWALVPPALRQRILLLGLAVILIAMALSTYVPQHMTWITTAFIGAILLAWGAHTVLHHYAPRFDHGMRLAPGQQLGLFAVFVLSGMLIQRFAYWPKKKNDQLSAKDLAASLRPV